MSDIQFDLEVMHRVAAVIILPLAAMIFRNLHLVIKRPEGGAPFRKGNVRMLKEIGIFSISIPAVSLIMGTVALFVIGFEAVEISNSISGFVVGIICFA